MERLYFYWRRPTETQRKEAVRLGAKLRDARAVRNPPYEPCDEAYGEVPEVYMAYKTKPKAAKKKAAKKRAKKTARKS